MEDARARKAFHWALAGIFIPCLGVLASGVLALLHQGGVWGRRLAALAVVDILIIAVLVLLVVLPERMPRPAVETLRIGVMFEADRPGPPVVESVAPGWPAEQAGLKAGDVLKAVEGTAISSAEEARQAIQARGAVEQTLTVEREGRAVEIKVVPRTGPLVTRGLFEPVPSEGTSFELRSLLGVGLAGLIAAGAWLAGRRRPGPRAWRGFVLADLFFLGGSFGSMQLLEKIQGGVSQGGMLIGLMLGHTCMGIGGLLACAWLRADRPPDRPPEMGPARAFLLACLYVLTCYPRAACLLLGIDVAVFGGGEIASNALRDVASTLEGPLGVGLFLLMTSVIGPIAEEIVFRGLLLPRVAARLGRNAGLLATSLVFGALHANYGLYAPLTAVLGWILGWSRFASGGLAVPILLHMTFNAAVSALFFVKQG